MAALRHPVFDCGFEFRELHPTREGSRRWRYVVLRPVTLMVDGLMDRLAGFRDDRALSDMAVSFRDRDGLEWMRMDRWGITITAGYCWNGCSPKRWLPLLGWVGTPDFPATRCASLFHDALYQFHACQHMPLHRSEADAIFRRLIELRDDVDLARLYWSAVRRMSRWSGASRNGEHSVII